MNPTKTERVESSYSTCDTRERQTIQWPTPTPHVIPDNYSTPHVIPVLFYSTCDTRVILLHM